MQRVDSDILVGVICAAVIGYIVYASASIPLQDEDMAPASVLAEQVLEVNIGKIMMLVGIIFSAALVILKLIKVKRRG